MMSPVSPPPPRGQDDVAVKCWAVSARRLSAGVLFPLISLNFLRGGSAAAGVESWHHEFLYYNYGFPL